MAFFDEEQDVSDLDIDTVSQPCVILRGMAVSMGMPFFFRSASIIAVAMPAVVLFRPGLIPVHGMGNLGRIHRTDTRQRQPGGAVAG